MSQGPTKKTASVGTRPNPSLEEQIRNRAYQLYEERGPEDGHDLEDWLSAESEISRMVAKAAHFNAQQHERRRLPSFPPLHHPQQAGAI